MQRTFEHALTTRPARYGVLALVAAWGLYQSAWNLFRANVQTDEPAYQQAGWGYLHGNFTGNVQHPPLAKYLMGLAQLAFGEGVEAARIPIAVLSVLGGLVMFLWLRRDLGWYSGVLAAGMWWLLPRGITGDPTRIDRLALLDGPMAVFCLAGLWAGWRWASGGRWPWIVAAGILMAASVTSKEASAVVVPVFIVLPILFRRWWGLLWGGLLFAAAFAATFVLVYLPFGVVGAVRYMIDFQSEHAHDGHTVTVAGAVYQFPPWWANLWFENAGTGGAVSVILCAGLLCAIVIRPGRLVLVLALALTAFLVFFVVIASVALAEYYFAWMPILTLLAAVGITRLATVVPVRWIGRSFAALLVVLVLVSAARFSVTTAHIRKEGLARVQGVLDRSHRSDVRIFSAGFAPSAVSANFGDQVSVFADTGPFGAIVIGDDPRYPLDAVLAGFLREHPDEFRQVDLDGTELYLPRGQFQLDGDHYEVVR